MEGILARINNFFNVPFDPLKTETNKANITSTLIKVTIFLCIGYLIPGVISWGISPQLLVVFIALLLFIIFQISIRRGYTNQVSHLMITTFWLIFQGVFLFLENGIRAPAYTAGLAFLIVFAGILNGGRGAVILTSATLLVSATVIIFEINGIFLTEAKIPNALWAGFGQLLFFISIAFLVTRNHSNLQQSIKLFKRESHDRLEAELEIRKLNKELTLAYDTTLEGWARALELRDKETEGHSRRVTELSWQLARKLGFDQDDLVWLRHGALLHDIGKMGIPDEILNKPGALDPQEREIINTHPQVAYNLLKDIRYLDRSIEIPYYHHERWDGSGYPKGLAGEAIPLSARIFAVVDVWDALNHDRPYRDAWPEEDAVKYLQENAGTQFDPQVVEVFLSDVIYHRDN